MVKFFLLGAAALVMGAVVFSAPDADAKLSACDVDGRGEAIIWAKQNPGVSYKEACQGLGDS